VSRVLFAGDWHANAAHARAVLALAADIGAERVVQVGDFGYWPRTGAGRVFVAAVADAVAATGIGVWFCDGNHEDHGSLPHGEARDPVEVAPGVRWVPRGTVVAWEERRLLFMGGAVSVDQRRRAPGWSWFPSETPSPGQWERAMGAGKVDVVVAHDTVPGMPVQGLPFLSIPWSARRRAAEHRSRLEELQRSARPSLWVHGHWHDRATARLGGTRFESLAHDGAGLARSVLGCELDDLSTWEP